ncbi:MAG: hypothetical protein ABI237_14730 [Ginsengibacter sp.]
MKPISLLFLGILGGMLFNTTSCNSQGNTGPTKKISSTKFTEGKDYNIFTRARVLDKTGFSKPVEAFSLLIPKGWKYSGDILWTPPGSTCAGTNSYFKATSPDGKYSFELLPSVLWVYVTDPQLAQFQQQNSRSAYCSYGEPLDAEHYLKQMFVPRELGNPQFLEMKTNEPGAREMQIKSEKYRQEMMSYNYGQINSYPSAINAKVKWNDGSEGIVTCGVLIMEGIIPNAYDGSYSKTYTSSAMERVVFKYPAGEGDKAVNMLSTIMSSVRTNTAWKNSVDNYWLQVRQKSYVNHIGKIKMMDDLTRQIGEQTIRNGQKNLNNIDVNMRSWEATQQSQDRMHTNFVKAIREVENYQDATGKVELSSGYNHAWSRSDGSSFIMSNNPNFDPSSLFQDQRWKEMKKVD